jgi:hypothetical protein
VNLVDPNNHPIMTSIFRISTPPFIFLLRQLVKERVWFSLFALQEADLIGDAVSRGPQRAGLRRPPQPSHAGDSSGAGSSPSHVTLT